MHQGSSIDPRRPDKVQRYKPNPSNGNGQGEDLTPDYMNILGQHATTANAAAEALDKHTENVAPAEPNLSSMEHREPLPVIEDSADVQITTTSNATNVIPTSPQYGVAIIPNALSTADPQTENLTAATDSIVDTIAKPPDEGKELHSTPSRNDRFKVVKIASLEPFKRGRWKCMDYVDETPPLTSQQTKVTQSTGSIQVAAGGVYFQTQSLPPQQIQQMLLQGGFTNGTQFVPTQVMPQGQYFYPQVTTIQTQTIPQLVNSSGVPSSMPQFINTSQPYFAASVVPNAAGFTMPQSYPNIQYLPTNLIPNQNSAFVPTSQVQLPPNFQQSQTYAGQPNVTQSTVAQPMVNGHAYPQQNDQQVTSSSLPTQTAKSVILNASQQQQQQGNQQQINQTTVQNQLPPQTNTQVPGVQVLQNPQFPQNTNFQQLPGQQQNQSSSQVQQAAHNINPAIQAPSIIQVPQVVTVPSQSFDQSLANNVYTNPQFAMSVNSLTVLENNENSADNVGDSNSGTETTSENPDDPAKTNPVVNAIDNKIEQAMDLVKSHLMYTVREEVEVLKEKIAELMERIQQLESENNYLRSQIPKNQQTAGAPTISNTPPTNTPSITNTATANTATSTPTATTNVVPNAGDTVHHSQQQ